MKAEGVDKGGKRNKTKQNKTKQNKTKQNKTKQSKTKRGNGRKGKEKLTDSFVLLPYFFLFFSCS